MRLDELIEVSGFFWLPEEPTFRVPGDLYISESCEVRLDIRIDNISSGWLDVVHARRPSADGYDIDRILGGGVGRGLITLDKCVVRSDPNFGVGPTELKVFADLAFTGHHYQAGEDVTFTELTFSVEGIGEWLAVPWVDVQHDPKNATAALGIRVPDNISLNLPVGAVLQFKFEGPSLSFTNTETRATQKAFLSLLSKEPKPLQYFTTLATKLRNFLRLATGKPVSMYSVTGYSTEITRPDGSGEERLVPIRVYYQEGGNPDHKQEVEWFRVLFNYKDVSDQLEEILANWLDKYEDFRPALDVYFTSMSDTDQYLEVEFLQRVQGIETLHRRSSEETAMPEEEFAGIKKALLMHCPRNRREWLEIQLRYANGLSLRQRLRAMIEPFERFYGDNNQQKGFINKVVDTRNYLTHYDSGLEGQAAKGKDLWELSRKLEALFQLHLLRLIGFDDKRIDRALHVGSDLRRLLLQSGLRVPEPRGPSGGTL